MNRLPTEALAQAVRSHGHRDVTYVEKRADVAAALLPASALETWS